MLESVYSPFWCVCVNSKIVTFSIFIWSTLAKLFCLNVKFVKAFVCISALPVELLTSEWNVFWCFLIHSPMDRWKKKVFQHQSYHRCWCGDSNIKMKVITLKVLVFWSLTTAWFFILPWIACIFLRNILNCMLRYSTQSFFFSLKH